jgi:cob(I)alamin adenosyltransferase
MTKEPFDQPRLAINRVYTRKGDSGETALVGGQRVPKDGTRIEAYGTVDELNSFLGAARADINQLAVQEPRLALLAAILLRVQHELFNLGSILATLPEDVHPRQPRVTDAEIAQLETEMDLMNEDLRRCAPSYCRVAAGSMPAFTSAEPSAAAPNAL